MMLLSLLTHNLPTVQTHNSNNPKAAEPTKSWLVKKNISVITTAVKQITGINFKIIFNVQRLLIFVTS